MKLLMHISSKISKLPLTLHKTSWHHSQVIILGHILELLNHWDYFGYNPGQIPANQEDGQN